MSRKTIGGHDKTCSVCGKPFKARTKQALACSDACRVIVERARQRACEKRHHDRKRAQKGASGSAEVRDGTG